MQMDAMVLNQEASAATPFLRFQTEYFKLREFESPETPFAGGSDVPPAQGIYLHWTLPKALRHGIYNQDGSTTFPYAPNRWLVVRTEGGQPAGQAVKAWILESDFLDQPGPQTQGSNPFIDPQAMDSNGLPVAKTIGKAQRFTPELKTLPDSVQFFLKAVGPGSVTFANFSPGVQNVFAFTDDVTTGDDATLINEGTFTYQVIGWYSNPTIDPLTATKWEANTDASLAGTYANDTLDWYVYAAEGDELPQQTLVHALISNVVWNRTADNPPPVNYPTNIQTNVKVAVGNTAIDALSAMVRLDKNSQTEADLLEAFQYGSLEQFDRPGSHEALNMAIRQHWYGASSGGTLWKIVGKERTDNTALPAPQRTPLTPAEEQLLATLNVGQRELDRQQRILESMQWNLFALWWKNMWMEFSPTEPPVDDDLINWLTTQLPLHLGPASTCNNANGNDPSQESWYYCKVNAQQNLVSGLSSQAATTHDTLLASLDQSSWELKSINMPQYYYPNDPVLLVTGLGRSTNFDPADGLMCRLSSQVVSELTVGGQTYCAGISCTHDIAAQIPVLSDPNNLLPDGVQQLNAESLFLSPVLFAQNILGDSNQAAAVSSAIKALPAPAAGVSFAPAAFSFEEWQQPWVPLLLDWEVTVLQAPTYTCEVGKPSCAFNQNNWTFDGTDYNWSGPTASSGDNFNEGTSQMVLQGRTFITPYLAFTLADQLDDYVAKHQLRDPNLEALLKDLDGYIDGIKNQDMLSQRLSGMMAMMIQRDHTKSVPPSGDITKALGDYQHGFPLPNPDPHSSDKPVPWDFGPLGGTFFVINRLSVYDTFGRSIDLMLANYNGSPQTQGSVAEYYFYPITGWNMKSPTGVEPAPGLGQSSDPTERMIQLPPRAVQDSQLSFRFTSNDGENNDIDLVAGANPVCGFVVPNHLDRSLAFYAPDGTAWGEFYLSLHAGNSYVPVWQPDPTNAEAPQTVAEIPNQYVRGMLQALAARNDEGVGFYDLLQVIDETLWTINPRGQRKDQNLSVLIGRPLAIVRASVSLKLRGLPFYSQDWPNTFDVDPQNLPDPTQPASIGAVDGLVSSGYLWPVRLGSQALRDDGVIGYYLDDPTTPANSFNLFNTVNLPANAQTSYLNQIGANNYLQLGLTDDTVTAPDAKKNEVCGLTMLVDPRGSIHAFTGLLPVLSVDIPGEFITAALEKMYYMFRAGPFLTPPDAVKLPRPAERKGTWTWFDKVLNATTAIVQADGKVSFPVTPPLVKEGWLKFTPNPDTNDESA